MAERGLERDAQSGDDRVVCSLGLLCAPAAAPACPDCGERLSGRAPRDHAPWVCPSCGSAWNDTRVNAQWHLLAGALVVFGALPDEALVEGVDEH